MRIQSPPERVLEAVRIVRLEYESVGRAVLNGIGRGVGDRIDEATRGSHERDRAVAKSVELREPARLVAAGHEHDVGGGLHQVREALVEADDEVDRARKRCRHVAERLLDMVVAGAEQHEAGPPAASHAAEQVDDEIDPLLIHESTDEGNQRPRVGSRMPEPHRQRHAGCILPVGEVLRGIGAWNVTVCPWVPGDRVDAVDDAGEYVAPRGEHSLQPTAAWSRLDLPRVGRTHRGQSVGEHKACLEQVELAPELHLLPVEIFPVESRKQHVPIPEEPLVGHVVDRHHGAGVLHGSRRLIEQLLVGGHEARLPVMAMDDVEWLPLPRGQFHRGTRKEDEPLGVVAVVLRPAIQRRTVEALVVGHEQDLDPRLRSNATENPGVQLPHADRHIEGHAGGLDRQPLGKYLSVGGDHERDVTALVDERLGQGAAHIGESARLGKGGRLTGHLQHTHRRKFLFPGARFLVPDS